MRIVVALFFPVIVLAVGIFADGPILKPLTLSLLAFTISNAANWFLPKDRLRFPGYSSMIEPAPMWAKVADTLVWIAVLVAHVSAIVWATGWAP